MAYLVPMGCANRSGCVYRLSVHLRSGKGGAGSMRNALVLAPVFLLSTPFRTEPSYVSRPDSIMAKTSPPS